MELIEIISNDVFRIPIKKGSLSIGRTLEKNFDIYLDLLKNLKNRDKFTNTINGQISDIEKLCNKILQALKSYLQGSPYKAYNAFSEGISNIEGFLYFRIRERMKYPEGISLFRIRASKNKYLSQGDIFHIPFESRGKIRNQRFSIDGFPCLYLGSSIYVCWEELNRPNFENLFISKFKLLTKRPNILDLTFQVDDMKETITNFIKDNDYYEWLLFNIVEKIIIFPLIISCSIINKESSDIFKEEYIIPQLLLEWVRDKHKINAIKYLSLSLPDYNLHHSLYTNYVFPAKRQKLKGCCSFLYSIFELTDPISWNFAKSLHVDSKIDSSDLNFNFNILNQKRSYKNTQFGQMEEIIGTMPSKKHESI